MLGSAAADTKSSGSPKRPRRRRRILTMVAACVVAFVVAASLLQWGFARFLEVPEQTFLIELRHETADSTQNALRLSGIITRLDDEVRFDGLGDDESVVVEVQISPTSSMYSIYTTLQVEPVPGWAYHTICNAPLSADGTGWLRYDGAVDRSAKLEATCTVRSAPAGSAQVRLRTTSDGAEAPYSGDLEVEIRDASFALQKIVVPAGELIEVQVNHGTLNVSSRDPFTQQPISCAAEPGTSGLRQITLAPAEIFDCILVVSTAE